LSNQEVSVVKKKALQTWTAGNLRVAGCASLLIVFTSLLAACDKPAAPQAQPPEVTIMTVAPKNTPVTFEFVGSTASSQQVEVRARVNGFLDHRQYTEGAVVKQGQVMFQMDPKPFEAQLKAAAAALDEQKARLWTAQANLNRVKPLAKANAVSKKDLDDAQGQVNAAAAAVELAGADVETAKLNLGYTSIYAPVTGASSFARIQDGAYVNEQSGPLTYVAQLDPIWVDFSISEDEMLRIREQKQSGQLLTPETTALDVRLVLSDGSMYPETGRIFFTDANYSTKTGTFLLRATFSNPEANLRPGQFVRVHIEGATRPDAVLIPQQAVLQGAQGHFVWILDQASKAQVRGVEVGSWQGDNWFITQGLAAGDRVVTDGLMRLAKGTPVRIATGAGDQPAAQPAAEVVNQPGNAGD
jgi:membrane fusion protein (multidrug efflux system)